jgi:putative oxidoreductase
MISVMIVAAVTVHWKNGMWATKNGVELPLLYAAASVGLALTGPGEYSLDTLLGWSSLWTPAVTWSVLAVGALAGTTNLVLRRRVEAPVAQK